jgi:hypothetical protein
VGRRPGAAGIARRRGLGGAAGGRRKEREGERLTGGPRSSTLREKKKKRRGEEWAGAGGWMVGCWAAWAERESALVSLFFFFFKLHFQTNIHFKFKSNLSNFFSRIL